MFFAEFIRMRNPNKTRICTLFFLAITLFISGCSENTPISSDELLSNDEPLTKIDQTMTSSSGDYHFHLSSSKALYVSETQVLELTAHMTDSEHEPGLGLVFSSVKFIMPIMDHGGNKFPYFEEVGDGVYLIKDIQTSMSGAWDLELIFNSGDDTVTFELMSDFSN